MCTVNAIFDNLDTSEIESTYKGGGTTSYHPRMLLKVIVYAYLTNVYSGRRMASLLEENVFFMWLAGMNRPDFRTINRFRSEKLADGRFESIFHQVVDLLHDEGVADKKLRKAVTKVKEESLTKLDEYDKHLEILGERNSYSKTDSDATFMHMKEDAMNNGQCGFKRFHLRSARKTKVEWGLVSLAHNLRKYVAYKAEAKHKQIQSMVITIEKTLLKHVV